MFIARYSKSANERKRYTIDYSDWLDTAELVSTTLFTIETNTIITPLVIDGYLLDGTGMIVSFFVSGGVQGVQYSVIVKITTNGGQIKEDAILFDIVDVTP